MKKAGLPAATSLPGELREYLQPVYENLEILTGVRGNRINPLPANATNEEIIAKINELLELLQ